MIRLTARTSTIFIATADNTRVYRSIKQVPAELRRKLHRSTNSINSATILIADKRGQQELLHAFKDQPEEVQRRLAAILGWHESPERSAQPPRVSGRPSFFPWRRVLEVLLPATLGATLWFFIDSHF